MNAEKITTKDLSDRLATSPAYVRRLVGEGLPTAGYIGKQLAFDVEAVKLWLMGQGLKRKRLLFALNVPEARNQYTRKNTQRRGLKVSPPESTPESDAIYKTEMAKLLYSSSMAKRGGCKFISCKSTNKGGHKIACKGKRK